MVTLGRSLSLVLGCVLVCATATLAASAGVTASAAAQTRQTSTTSTTSTTTTTTTTTAPSSSTTSTTAPSCTGNLTGEGGAFFQPVIDKLLRDDTSDLAPLCPQFTNVTLDDAISDFVGTGPSQFNNDFAVSERPLTSTEAATATTDGRSFAYVPFAATPVALGTLVPAASYVPGSANTISSSDFCQDMPLTTQLIGDIFGLDAGDPLQNWGDSRITCNTTGESASCSSGTGAADAVPIALWANADPTMENETLIDLLDSSPTTQQLFDAALNPSNPDKTLDPVPGVTDAPSESWPYAQNTVPGGDDPLIGKLLHVDAETNQPDSDASNWQLGAIFPMSSVWTGSPLGVAWDIPTAAVQNAQGSCVPPSETAAAAAEADATLASTSDPTTDNLVTFNADSSDAKAYNNYLMLEDYLVVPTTSLDSGTATKLAQFVRFVLGTTGQKDISSFGAAPATSAMVTAGLKVADELDAEAVSGSSSSTTSTTTASGSSSSTGSSSTGSAASTASAGTSSDQTGGSGSGGSGGDGSGGSGSGSGSVLAFTGSNPLPILMVAALLVLVAEPFRRALRRRREPLGAVASVDDAPARPRRSAT